MTNSLLALRGRHQNLTNKYVHSQGSASYHFRLVQQMREIREEIQALTRPQTVLDWDGSFEERLVNSGVKFTVRMVPVPSTNPRELWPTVAEITVGMVN